MALYNDCLSLSRRSRSGVAKNVLFLLGKPILLYQFLIFNFCDISASVKEEIETRCLHFGLVGVEGFLKYLICVPSSANPDVFQTIYFSHPLNGIPLSTDDISTGLPWRGTRRFAIGAG